VCLLIVKREELDPAGEEHVCVCYIYVHVPTFEHVCVFECMYSTFGNVFRPLEFFRILLSYSLILK
jgi:hypothetical protein